LTLAPDWSRGDAPTRQPQPRYRQILEALRHDIGRGAFPVGSSLPTESELCDMHGASRHTVREALRGLVELGMVARRQGSGSVVTSAMPNTAYSQSIRSMSDLFQLAVETHFTKLSMRMLVPSAAIQSAIGGARGERWLLMRGLRQDHEGGKPICYIHSYIPERLAWIGPELPGCLGPFYGHIEQRSNEPIVEAVQEISGETMTAPVAHALGRRPGSVTLRVLRRYMSARGVLITSLNWHPADDFVVRTQIQRARD
jgi:DNA-binding GntR family transcriptional regulator